MTRQEPRPGENRMSQYFKSPTPRGLVSAVGRAMGRMVQRALATSDSPTTRAGLEALEPRQLLDGNFGSAGLITLDVNTRQGNSTPGLFAGANQINPAVGSSDNDYYRFVAPVNGFVSVLADTTNESPASTLNTRITVYGDNDLVNPVATGTNNGVLTSGTAPDGWAGFYATAGRTYYAIVSSEGAQAGTYTLRVNAQNQSFDLSSVRGIGIPTMTPDPDVAPFPAPRAILGEFTRLSQDIVYRYTVPAGVSTRDSLITISAEVTQANLSVRLDSRIDVYKRGANDVITLVASDSDAGRLNDAFVSYRPAPGDELFIRVRSDEVRPSAPTAPTGLGSYYLVFDAIANNLPQAMNPVTRIGSDAAGLMVSFGTPLTPSTPPTPSPVFQTASYNFIAQGTGLAIITAIPRGTPPPPVTDPAVRIFDSNGVLVAYNDNFAGLAAQLKVQLIGGQRYYVVVDGFEVNSQVGYGLYIESNHTFEAVAPNTNDDHANPPGGGLDPQTRQRLLDNATAMVFGAAQATFDADANLVRDRGLRVQASSRGRIENVGDIDLFQFTAPTDMLSNYAGNNDDQGTSLFVGGAFTRAGVAPGNRATVSRTLATWDASDWWVTGRQNFDANLNVQFGFNNNPATPGTNRPEIYGMYDWLPDPTAQPAVQGTTNHILIVMGDFNLTILTPLGPVTVQNIAAWRWSQANRRFVWDVGLFGSADGPVRAATVFDPVAYDPDGGGQQGPLPTTTDPHARRLFVAGSFTNIGGVAASRIASFVTNPAATAGAFVPLADADTGTDGVDSGSINALTVYDPRDAGGERAWTDRQPPIPPPPAPPPPITEWEKPYVADTPDLPVSLILGGDFDCTTFDQDGAARVTHGIALWTGSRFESVTSGRVDAIAGPPGGAAPPTNPAPRPWGGDEPDGSGLNAGGVVNSLIVYTAPDPDDAGPLDAAGPYLYIAGQFTSVNGVTATNIARWGALGFNQDPQRPTMMDPPPPAGPGPLPPNAPMPNPAPPLLPTPGAINAYAPQLIWEPLQLDPYEDRDVGAVDEGVPGAGATIFAMGIWDPTELNGAPQVDQQFLIVGGQFTSRGRNVAVYGAGTTPNGDLAHTWLDLTNQGIAGTFFGAGFDGTVRSIAVTTDVQEPSIATNLRPQATIPQPVVYFGGDFRNGQNVDGSLVNLNRVGQWSAVRGQLADFYTHLTLNGGIDADVAADFGPTTGDDPTDPPQYTPRVYSVATYDDGNPYQWDRHDRPGSRLSISVSPTADAFINMRVRVFDSNFNVVYDFGRPGSETINPPFPDPAGMTDPSVLTPQSAPDGGQDPQLNGIQVWGGETYYVEISDYAAEGQTRGGSGRYTVTLVADTNPADFDGDGTIDLINTTAFREEANQGVFNLATDINTQLATGDGRNQYQPDVNGPNSSTTRRAFRVNPSGPFQIVDGGDMGNIDSLTDSDLYSFRAEFTGTAEIRVKTRAIEDAYIERVTNLTDGTVTDNVKNKTYNSALDAAMRIYRNDFEQVAYADENTGVRGDFSGSLDPNADAPLPSVGTTFAGIEFTRHDPRVVINVVAGNTYFIQVESGQRYKNGTPKEPANRVANIDREIDWRRATGSYEVLIHQLPNLEAFSENGVAKRDDMPDFNGNNFDAAAVIPINDDRTNTATNGTGSILANIDNRPNAGGLTLDNDLYKFVAPGPGNLVITLSRTTGSVLDAQMQIGDHAGRLLDDPISLPNGGLRFTRTNVQAGDWFYILINGTGVSEGGYRVDISGVASVDDYTDDQKWSTATDIRLLDFQGLGTISGSIESAGDSDAFRFGVQSFATFTVSVTATTPDFDPFVTIYEVQEDGAGRPVYQRIAYNDDIDPGVNTNSRISFPVTPDRTANGRTYPYYYLVVRGFDPLATQGNYTVQLSFPPTDDFADGDTNSDTVFDTVDFPVAGSVLIDPNTGAGAVNGNIEITTDTDLFTYQSPASGTSTVTIARTGNSTLRFIAYILDQNAAILATSTPSPDAVGAANTTVSFAATRGTRYFLVVAPYEDMMTPNVNSTKTGTYSVNIFAPPIDDHANATEWSLATAVVLDSATGAGQLGGVMAGDASNPRLNYAGDSDLFKFTTLATGDATITISPFDSMPGTIAPRLTIFRQTGANTFVQVGSAVSATMALQQVSFTITAAPFGTTYYVLVDSATGVMGSTATGEFQVRVQSAAPTTPPGNGDPSVVDFMNPIQISLDARTGDADTNGNIDTAGRRQLFTFTTPAYTGTGKVYVQVVTPNGSPLRATVRILRNPNELQASEVVFNSDGIPGTSSSVSFDSAGNRQYWVVVDGVDAGVGTYVLRVNTQPVVNRIYFPEGFANDGISEFVSVVNPNNVAATYRVVLRYEGDGNPIETIVDGGTIAPNSRSGVTLSDSIRGRFPGVLKDVPYAIIVESDVPVGATLAHYDFGTSIGEAFLERVDSTWNFARVERNPGNVNDFIVLYNPSDVDVVVTMTAYQTNRAPIVVSTTFSAGRRGGWAINDLPQLHFGVFSVVLTSRAANLAQAAQFKGIVASLSHYEQARGTGFAVLGDQGSNVGAIPTFQQGGGVDSQLVLFNPNNQPVTITLTGSYARTNITWPSRTIQIAAGGQTVLNGSTLGLLNAQPLGIRYSATAPVSAVASQTQKGDADGISGITNVGTRFFFGDAFISTGSAGTTYFETLSFYNPTAFNSSVNVKLLFLDGTSANIPVTINARGFAEVRLHERPEIIQQRSGDVFFAIDATSALPFAMEMTHFDLFFGSGWGTGGTPFGIVNPLNRIP